jgi:hypothetical protein
LSDDDDDDDDEEDDNKTKEGDIIKALVNLQLNNYLTKLLP